MSGATSRPKSGAASRPMTAPATVVRVVAGLGVRSVFGRRRGVLLYLLPVVLVGLAVLVRVMVGTDDSDSDTAVLHGLGLAVLVPLVALISTSGLLAPEIDDGSIAYLLAKPVNRHVVVLGKLLVAVGCVTAFAAVPLLVAGLLLRPGDPSLAIGYAVGSLAGGAAYCSLFALLSIRTRHAVVAGLVYLLVWESLLGGLLDGVRWLSVTRWSARIVEALSDAAPVSVDLSATYAVVACLVVVLGGAWVAGSRLRAFNLTGDE